MKNLQTDFKLLAKKNSLFLGMLVFLFLAAGGFIIFLQQHGFFQPWLNLGNPLQNPESGERVVKILSASPRSVRVGTNHSRAFETVLPWIAWKSEPAAFPWRWNETEYEETDPSLAAFGCPYTFWVPPLIPALFRDVIDQIEVKGCRMDVGIEQAKFIILSNGTIWVWENQKYLGKD